MLPETSSRLLLELDHTTSTHHHHHHNFTSSKRWYRGNRLFLFMLQSSHCNIRFCHCC